jgi:hypothetical protein
MNIAPLPNYRVCYATDPNMYLSKVINIITNILIYLEVTLFSNDIQTLTFISQGKQDEFCLTIRLKVLTALCTKMRKV